MTVSTAGWYGVKMIRYNGQHGPLEGREVGSAKRSARPVEVESG